MRTCFVAREWQVTLAVFASWQLNAGRRSTIARRTSDSISNRTGTIGAKRQLYERLASGQDRRNLIGHRRLQLGRTAGQSRRDLPDAFVRVVLGG